MRTYCKDVVRIPEYAINQLINNDLSYLCKEDKDNISKFMQSYHDIASNLKDGNVIVCLVGEQPESYFSWHPSFGLPGSVYDCYVTILYTNDKIFDKQYLHPDVGLVLNEYDIITNCESYTDIGTRFISAYKIIGASYKTIVESSHGICFNVERST